MVWSVVICGGLWWSVVFRLTRSETLLVAHTTLLEISCTGSIVMFNSAILEMFSCDGRYDAHFELNSEFAQLERTHSTLPNPVHIMGAT